MNKQINTTGYVSTGEASVATNYSYSPRQINKLCEVARIKFIPPKKSPTGQKLVYLNDVLRYAAAHPRERFNVVWDAIEPLKGESFYILKDYDTKIMISNKCRVIDTTHGSVIKPHLHRDLKGNLTGYYSVPGLMQNGKAKAPKLHTLVGKTQCDNALDKTQLHHIKPVNRKNPRILENVAKNLIYVWEDQQKKLHKLLDNGKIEDYKTMIKNIQRENKQKVYKIPHPDYTSDSKWDYWLYLNTKGYKQYKKDGNISLENIILERAEAIDE